MWRRIVKLVLLSSFGLKPNNLILMENRAEIRNCHLNGCAK